MEDIPNLIGNTGVPAMIYYTIAIISGVFLAGWAVNGKIKKMLGDEIKSMDARVGKLETETLRTEVHNKDLLNIFQLFNGLRDDFKDGFKGLNSRIDALLLATTSKD